MKTNVIVACIDDASGYPTLLGYCVTCTHEQREGGLHYDAAIRHAEDEGPCSKDSSKVCFDDSDGPDRLFTQFEEHESFAALDITEQGEEPT